MTEKRRLLVNASMSMVQVVVSAAAFFLLYRYLLETIGNEQAGVWALVLSWTSALGIADLGITGGAVKFVSSYLAREDWAKLRLIVQTSILTVAIALLIIVPAVYPLLIKLLELVIEPSSRIADALVILPYAAVSFWITSVTNVIYSCIDGMQRVYLRNLLVMSSAVLYLVLAFILVPVDGLVGLARAQVVQAALMLAGSWIVLKFLVRGLPVLPYRWSTRSFREMFGYGLNFQIISLSYFLFQPLTKSLISKFGGVGAVFFFEMAHKLVMQLRALIVMAHQSIVPAIARLQETDQERIQAIYRDSFRLLLVIVATALPILIGLTPVISRLWIGAYEPSFILFAVLMFVGWFLNILVNPAYFSYLGIGRLRWNVIGHLTIGVLNAVGGVLLGLFYGAAGVVIAFAAAIVIGSVVITVAYHREYGIRWSEVVDRRTLILGLVSVTGLAAVLYIHELLRGLMQPLWLALVLGLVYVIVIAIPVWTHPLRSRLQTWISDAIHGQPRPSISS